MHASARNPVVRLSVFAGLDALPTGGATNDRRARNALDPAFTVVRKAMASVG